MATCLGIADPVLTHPSGHPIEHEPVQPGTFGHSRVEVEQHTAGAERIPDSAVERRLALQVVNMVHSKAGGAGGGSSHLTRQGERLVALYERFRRAMETDLGREFQELFKE
ncbi:MAG: hypothetical protein IH959_08770 [Chloroflexi bacterium]|nr:hypothetical protein [Chloroflexota bacterium]